MELRGDGWNQVDRIVLGEGISRDELALRRDGNHMVLVIGGLDSGDSITIENAYTDKRYRIEQIELSDGTQLTPQSLPLLTTEGDDVVEGGGFDETVTLLGGNDTLNAGGGHDTVSGGSGNDTVHAGAGNDVVRGDEGDDTLHGQDGDDQLFGGVGNDTLTVNGSGSNTLEGGEGDDLLKVNRSVDVYYQRDHVRKAVNTFNGGQGNDRLEGSAGAETYVFNRGDGQDTINDYDHNSWSSVDGWNQVDRIVLGEGISRDELALRRDGNHMVLVIGGLDSGDSITIENAYTDKRYRIEQIELSDGTQLTPQSLPLLTTEGDDVVEGGGFDETVTLLGGNDTLNAGGGHDTVSGGSGNDTVHAGAGNDVVRGDEGDDTLHGQDGDDQLFGGVGNDTLTVNGSGSNTLEGGEGDDLLKVNRSVDVYYQRDHVRKAVNTFNGGQGNDRLEGSAGAETYVFNRGDGQDTINDYDHNSWSSVDGWNQVDRIVLGEGISRDELALRRDGNHMVLVIGGLDSGDSITIENAYTDKRYRIEQIELSDGTQLTPQSLPLLTTEGEDVVEGGGFDETVTLLGGNDTLNAGGGHDTVSGGSGNDTVHAGAGNDVVRGDEGDDTLHGQDGDDQLFGGVGNDTLTVNGSGSNTLEGGEGDDLLKVNRSVDVYYQRDHVRKAVNTFNGGQGNDRLEGSAGAETYVFNRGDGQDTINDYDHNSWSSVDGWNQVDRIVLGEGISRDELALRRDGNHMVLVIGGLDSGDSITIENAYTDKRYRIEQIELSDGTQLTPQSLPLLTTEGDDVVEGGGFDETVTLLGGNDTLNAGGGHDTVSGGSGNDTVHAGAGNDVVRGDEGDDTLHGQDGDDQLFGGVGNDTLTVNGSGSNTLEGGEGDDLLKVNRSVDVYYQRDHVRKAVNTFNGGQGNDRLEGSAGAETYVFNRGDGQDTINDYDHNSWSSVDGWNQVDRIVLGEGISRDELALRRDGNHMVLVIGGLDSGDSITIENAYTDKRYRIEQIELSDGTQLTPQSLPLLTTEGDDVVEGGGFDETVTLLGGNDTLNAGGGHDTVSGGSGNDTVHAGAGNDVVRGDEGDDTLHGQDGDDQLFGGVGNDTLTVNGSGSNTLEGGEGDDLLKVNRSVDVYYQRDHVRKAVNTFNGGQGNDRLEGSAGAETYVFNRGDGQDTINDYDHNSWSSVDGWNQVDRIVLGEGISRDELALRRDGNHMVLVIGGLDSGDSITIENAYTDKRYRIEQIELSDGTQLTPQSLPLLTTEGEDVVEGGGFDETVTLLGGNDTLNAGGGHDTVSGGSGNDTVHAGAGNDVVRGDEGDDTLHGQDGDDQLFGGVGNDTLTVNGSGSNTLEGGEGDDLLKVNRSVDVYYQRDHVRKAVNTFNGGQGNDRLEGSAGAETYVFNRGDGQDTINDYDHNSWSSVDGWNQVDRIVLGEGISRDELALRRDGNHMVLVIGGLDSGDSITIENAYTDKRYRIEQIELSDGTQLTPQSLPLLTTEGDDVVEGGGFDETVTLLGGNDTLNAGGGHDTVSGGSGNDTVHAGAGNDVVRGDEGDDTLHGQDGDDQLFGGVGNDTLTVNGSGSNTLEGGEGDDLLKVNRSVDVYYQRDHVRKAVNTFNGGQGNDRLEGSAGAETYVFNRGDGQDTINDYDHNSWSSVDGWNQVDRIVLGEGISRDELALRRDGNHMVLVIGGLDSGDSITIENAYTDKRYRIEQIELSDGTQLTPQSLPLLTTEGDDVVEGGGFDETVTLLGGNDTLNAGGGHDTVSGGSGNDTVHAGAGNDVVRGDEGDDTLHGQDGDDQLFGGVGNDTLTVNGSGSNTLEGGEGDDLLKVNRSVDVYYQRDHVRKAVNTFNGGQGNDRLEGSAGAETYVFNRGDGQDTINDYDHNSWSSVDGWNQVDRIVLGEGISRDELALRRDGNHMVLVIGGLDSGDSITIENAYTDKRYRIEELVLSEGSKVSPFELPDYVEPVINTDLLVQAMGAFDTRESVTNNAVIDSVTSSFSPNLVVSGQIQL
ncbi:calcium-binding protein [Vibrio cholerae]|nr:calcium-binding protein [Vibrio cholerae]